jgi:hypothetical protein
MGLRLSAAYVTPTSMEALRSKTLHHKQSDISSILARIKFQASKPARKENCFRSTPKGVPTAHTDGCWV